MKTCSSVAPINIVSSVCVCFFVCASCRVSMRSGVPAFPFLPVCHSYPLVPRGLWIGSGSVQLWWDKTRKCVVGKKGPQGQCSVYSVTTHIWLYSNAVLHFWIAFFHKSLRMSRTAQVLHFLLVTKMYFQSAAKKICLTVLFFLNCKTQPNFTKLELWTGCIITSWWSLIL